MTSLLWIFLGVIIYCYFLYPLIIFVLAALKPRRITKAPYEPAVTVIMSIWNEEDVIASKMNNLKVLDYPSEKLEVLVASDASSDRTNEIVQANLASGWRLLSSDERKGKVFQINRMAQEAKGEVLVMTDARQEFAQDALRELTANFSDPAVGCVSGELIFRERASGAAKGVGIYWRYEKFIRRQESRVHSMLGATGAIYAIRKELYRDPPPDTVLDDMYIPFQAILQGYRAIFDEAPKAYDDAADSSNEEYRRKARTLYGNYQIFSLLPQMFSPVASPVALQLFSHKLLRLFIPFFLIALLGVSIILSLDGRYVALLVLQVLFYLAALTGGLARRGNYGSMKALNKLGQVPYMFCVMNAAAVAGLYRFLFSKQQITWEKARNL